MGATIVQASMWAVLTCLAAAATARWASATPPSPTDLAHCPKLCGDVNITYPFGIGAGCFRPGFEVTCNDSSRPPKLFLGTTTTEIVDQYPSGVYASIVFNIATTPGVLTYNRSWESPRKSLNIRPYDNYLVIVGCGIDVYMLNPDTGDVWGYCSTMCADMAIMRKEADGRACSGMGCCTITFQRPVRAFRISIVQKEETLPIEVANATLKAFLSYAYDPYQYNFSTADLMSDKIDASTIGNISVFLSTVITDQPNCRMAQLEQKSYACGSNNCVDDDHENGGYHCTCLITYFNGGNPYLQGGCIQGILLLISA